MSARDPERVRELVAAAIGANRVRSAVEPSDSVDGVPPSAVARPTAVEHVAEVLALAAREGLAVAPTGGGTRRGWGNPPARADVLLELGALDAIHDWSPRDGVAVVGAGVSAARLERQLAADGHTLAQDLPMDDRATLGGIAATGQNAFGMVAPTGPRWAVIGMKVAHPDGTITRHGARVAKNVAGLDLTKLHIGAFGTLGVIVELTIRTRPAPPATTTLRVRCGSMAAIQSLCLETISAGLGPARMSAGVRDRSSGEAPIDLSITFSGLPSSVRARCHSLRALAVRLGMDEAAEGAESSCSFPQNRFDSEIVIEIRGPLTAFAEIVALARGRRPGESGDLDMMAAPASGITWLSPTPTTIGVGGAPGAVGRVAFGERLSALRHAAERVGGSATVVAAPSSWKAGLDVWGDPPSAIGLMRKLKELYDPERVLNPGRFVGGI